MTSRAAAIIDRMNAQPDGVQTMGEGDHPRTAERRLGVEDIEIIASRHRDLGYHDGYDFGRKQGMSIGHGAARREANGVVQTMLTELIPRTQAPAPSRHRERHVKKADLLDQLREHNAEVHALLVELANAARAGELIR